jgi:hypothetical protein
MKNTELSHQRKSYMREYKIIMKIVSENRTIKNREKDLFEAGFDIEEKRCGAGGVGNIIELKNEVRIQIGYGHGKNNYAKCVVFYGI